MRKKTADDEKELTDTVNAYREAKAAAIAQKRAANETIGEAQKPDLDKIKAEKEETETVYQMAEKKYNQLKMDCKNNQEIFTAFVCTDGETQSSCRGTCTDRYTVPNDLRKCERFANGSGNFCTEILSGKNPICSEPTFSGNVGRTV